MSFFNLRRGGQSSKSAGLAAPAESLEMVRKRAKHRLVGSAVLVLLGVIGFPLLFDTQPRPVSVGIPIEIPSKQSTPGLSLPPIAAVEPAAGSAPGMAPVTPAADTAPATPPAPAPATPVAVTAAVTPAAPAAPVTASASQATPAKAAEKPADTAKLDAEAQRAQRLLEGNAQPASPVASGNTSTDGLRMVVQVGAFADAAKAREVRLKLERAGLKTYTQVAEAKGGKRIRVRVGPYSSKADADKAVKQIKALNLPAAILTL